MVDYNTDYSRNLTYDKILGYVPSVSLPFYHWKIWKWQKVSCFCGISFISRDSGLVPQEYANHYVLTHIKD